MGGIEIPVPSKVIRKFLRRNALKPVYPAQPRIIRALSAARKYPCGIVDRDISVKCQCL